MVGASSPLLAQIGRLATPPAEALGGASVDKARDFFREVCRILPWTMQNYKLDELTTLSALRRNVSLFFRQHAHVTEPRVVDVLIYKGREELEATYLQHKQRHHLIQDYVVKPEQMRAAGVREQNRKTSAFLDNFYRNMPTHQSAAIDRP
ncbi:hypothetical protein WJX73_010814 [Symbiochloris irregularis]|uniref:NADH dehydrogenase [ubiquinone] 1 alpha subcomplex subunit 6 n=1 Tax=Symbiochloris irregularis TaxID=706552 RepID=A0AAW1P5E8_9CHLO